MRIAAFGPAFLPLLAAWVLSSRAGASRRGRGMVAAIDVLALLLTALLWNAWLGADLFSLFLSACVLGALTFAAVSPEQDIESLGLLDDRRHQPGHHAEGHEGDARADQRIGFEQRWSRLDTL